MLFTAKARKAASPRVAFVATARSAGAGPPAFADAALRAPVPRPGPAAEQSSGSPGRPDAVLFCPLARRPFARDRTQEKKKDLCRAGEFLSGGARRVRRHDGTQQPGRAAFTGGGVACCCCCCCALCFFPGVRAASSRLLLGSDLCSSCLPCLPAPWRRSRGVARHVIRVTRPLLLPHWRLRLLSTGQCNSAPASATVTDTVVVLSDVTLEGARRAFGSGAVKA